MILKIFCAWWGLDHLGIEGMIKKVSKAGFDGIECYIPENDYGKQVLHDLLNKYNLDIIAHQFQANGNTFETYAESFRKSLLNAAEFKPLFINSHTGKDFWSIEKNGKLLEIAKEVEDSTGIPIIHETHRGRFLYSASVSNDYFDLYEDLKINADFSHWTCVSESLLEDQQEYVKKAIKRACHIHARVGYEEGPQIPDPRDKDWGKYLDYFMIWWQGIIDEAIKKNMEYFTITPEFGPVPYTWKLPVSGEAVTDFFEINCWMKDYLKENIKIQ